MLNRRAALALTLFGLASLAFVLITPFGFSSSTGWGFSLSNLDTSCKPCQDFFNYAMGGWIKNNPIPPEYPNWGTFSELRDKNLTSLREILQAASSASASAGSNEQKIGDFYSSCMDTSAIDAAGLKPLASEFASIEAIKDTAGVQAEVARLQLLGINALFEFGSSADFKDSTHYIAEADQGGLALPDRDYYLRDDDRSKQLRSDYLAHVAKMFELAGDSSAVAASRAKTVMDLETSLAKASRKRQDLRIPELNYNVMTLAEMKSLTPDWSWPSYLQSVSAPAIQSANIGQPDFFREASRLLSSTPVADWKTYLRWHLLHAGAPALSDPFVQENFNFYGRKLAGTKELQPRWKRCVQSTNGILGEALGEVYVRKYFPPEAKSHALLMVNNLIAALRSDIPTLSWMGPQTKQAALAKLQAFTVKIGYPDKWRDYSRLSITRDNYLANLQRGRTFEQARQIAKIGNPVDRLEWGMTPPTVNAYYNPNFNEIVFPAGILQPPFYSPSADDAVNYGGMGAVIGHEISHGFDDEGAKFDGQGNMRDWWSPDDKKNFEQRGDCIVKQFDGYEVEPGLHQNGKLVLGESIGDLGGLTIAFAAYEKSIEGHRPQDVDGFTPEQRFFLGWAQVWGASLRPEYARLQANTNEHPLPHFRANGPLSNMEAFAKAFGCKKGDPMVREESCKIW